MQAPLTQEPLYLTIGSFLIALGATLAAIGWIQHRARSRRR